VNCFTHPILSIVRYSLLAAMFGVLGCADSVTYSRDTRNRGISHYNTGSHSEAAATFRQAIRQDPRDYRSHYYLGATYEAMNLPQQAVQSYKASLDVMGLTHEGRADADFRNRVLDGLAGAVARSDERHIELDALESAARANPHAEGYFLLAKAHRFSGDPDSALDAYNRALLMDGNNFLIVKEYGLYLEQLGMKDRAFPLIRQGYVMRPQDQDLDLALRRYGLIPGPSLRAEHELEQPLVPKGPVQVRSFRTENRLQRMRQEEWGEEPQTVQVPRD
jgi:tetratricopeptide (TPR) repeat protein